MSITVFPQPLENLCYKVYKNKCLLSKIASYDDGIFVTV